MGVTQRGVGPTSFSKVKRTLCYELQLQEDSRPIFSFKNNTITLFLWCCPYVLENLSQVQMEPFLLHFKPISSCLVPSENPSDHSYYVCPSKIQKFVIQYFSVITGGGGSVGMNLGL